MTESLTQILILETLNISTLVGHFVAKNAPFCVKGYCTKGAFNNYKFHSILTNYLSGQLWTFYIIPSPSIHVTELGLSTDHLKVS